MKALSFALALMAMVTAAAPALAVPRNLQKTRPGSMLRREGPMEEQAEDLRGEHEKKRDKELVTHYRRMAQLDVLQAVAQEARDLTLQEKVEEVRRKEVQRHYRAMMRLKSESEAALAAGVP